MLQTLLSVLIVACSALYVVWTLLLPASLRRTLARRMLRLLAEGLTNTQIAARLTLSPKTVDHHVSAVLAKLDVATREEAAERMARG